jgi:hypothetical protein
MSSRRRGTDETRIDAGTDGSTHVQAQIEGPAIGWRLFVEQSLDAVLWFVPPILETIRDQQTPPAAR